MKCKTCGHEKKYHSRPDGSCTEGTCYANFKCCKQFIPSECKCNDGVICDFCLEEHVKENKGCFFSYFCEKTKEYLFCGEEGLCPSCSNHSPLSAVHVGEKSPSTSEDKDPDFPKGDSAKVESSGPDSGSDFIFSCGIEHCVCCLRLKEFIRLLKKGCLICGKPIVRGGRGNNKSLLCNICLSRIRNNVTILKGLYYKKIDKLAGDFK